MNSFRHVQKAIEYEVSRQQDVLEDGDKVIQETRLFDSVKGVTMSMRDKEEAHDYRYFPDPDLVPVHITDEQLESWKASLPELPAQRRRRFMDEWKLPEQDADIILLLHTRDLDRANARPDVKCIVGKSRSTGTGASFLRFEKAFSEFTEGEAWAGRPAVQENDL